MELSEQLSQFKQEHLDKLEMLDSGTKRILDAIVEGQDVFQTAHKERITLTMTLHENTRRNINDTRQEIIREFRVVKSSFPPIQLYAYHLLATTFRHRPRGTVVRRIVQRYPSGL